MERMMNRTWSRSLAEIIGIVHRDSSDEQGINMDEASQWFN
jgi:hypothetical protein